MIADVTGIKLIPKIGGKNCPGNGKHLDETGNIIECLWDECDYYLCCFGESDRSIVCISQFSASP